MKSSQLRLDELGCSAWFVAQDPNTNMWGVYRTFDTVYTDSVTGQICYGMGTDCAGEYQSLVDADNKCNDLKDAPAKQGYILVS